MRVSRRRENLLMQSEKEELGRLKARVRLRCLVVWGLNMSVDYREGAKCTKGQAETEAWDHRHEFFAKAWKRQLEENPVTKVSACGVGNAQKWKVCWDLSWFFSKEKSHLHPKNKNEREVGVIDSSAWGFGSQLQHEKLNRQDIADDWNVMFHQMAWHTEREEKTHNWEFRRERLPGYSPFNSPSFLYLTVEQKALKMSPCCISIELHSLSINWGIVYPNS